MTSFIQDEIKRKLSFIPTCENDRDQKTEKVEGVRRIEVVFFFFFLFNEPKLVCTKKKKDISLQHVSAFRAHEASFPQVEFLSLACQSLTV